MKTEPTICPSSSVAMRDPADVAWLERAEQQGTVLVGPVAEHAANAAHGSDQRLAIRLG